MAERQADGFDHYNESSAAGKWTARSNTFGGGVTAGKGRNGSAGFVMGANDYLLDTYAGHSTWIVHMACMLQGIVGGKLIEGYDGTTLQWYWETITNSNKIALRRGDGTLLDVMDLGLPTLVYHHFALKVVTGNSGSAKLVVNKVTEFDTSSLDTQVSANASVDTIKITRGTSGSDLWLDDVVICDGSGTANNDIIGDIHLWPLTPNGAGASSGWTPSAGANYECVDDTTPDSDNTRVTDSTPGHIDLYTLTDLPVTGTVPFVWLDLFAAKSDAGDRRIRHAIRQSTTNDFGDVQTLATSYAWKRRSWAKQIDTSAWNKTAVDALQAGQELNT